MKTTPALGYPTLKAAIYALSDDGLSPKEIETRLGCRRQTVYARLSERRTANEAWPAERLDKLVRIHGAAMAVIAEAFGTTPADVAERLAAVRGQAPAGDVDPAQDAAADTPPAEPEQAPSSALRAPSPTRGEGEGGGVGEVAVPTPGDARPPAKAGVKGERVYGLRSMDGKWLTKDGKGFTSVPVEAWSGDAVQAKLARSRLANARFCKMRELDR